VSRTKTEDVLETIAGRWDITITSRSEVEQTTFDKDAAQRAVKAASYGLGNPFARLDRVKAHLRGYKVRVTLGPVGEIMVTQYEDGTGYYTIL